MKSRTGARVGLVSIVGAGQVGTMLGLALRGEVDEVSLADRDPGVARSSLARGAGDRAVATDEAFDADVVVLAVPIPEIVRLLEERGDRIRPGALVLDTGSVKRTVVQAMRRAVPPAVHAVGGHPMAGTERPGPGGADPGLLRGATFVLCAIRDDPEGIRLARGLVEASGARPVEMDAALHDAVVARASHLPHLVAAALSLVASATDQAAARRLAASGFAGATRLASSDPEMVAAVLTANADEVSRALREFRTALDRLGAALSDRDPDAGARVLEAARRAREELTR